ncbi:hypothetical protein [Jannaschia formosa]|uniref:hypothetical protein n=1 Tax=Jannaschia formosa TaxID=2259592 RepID=UPI000E1B757D|nr:hypothetical protein [Jannaschia formosa]TFL16917.1 hypothetical protein DR046_17450 [Jannaschia formosa]
MRTSLVLVLLLAACTTPQRPPPVDRPDLYVTTDAPVPFAVRQLLPRGVIPSDVRVRDNCYGYAAGGTVYPVLVPRSGQYCI